MKALDAYRDVLKELDKFESPTFEIKDFDYFYPKAISRYIADNYKVFDVIQKDIDDLGSIVKTNDPLTMDATGLIALPPTYRHMLHIKIKVKFIKAVGKYKINDVAFFYPERMKSSQKGFRIRNAFGRPNFRRYYYEISGNNFQLLFDSTAIVPMTGGANLWIDYIMQPATDPYLNPDKSSDYNQEVNNSTLFFNTGSTRNHVYYEVINVCREIFLENIESVRTQESIRQSAIQ